MDLRMKRARDAAKCVSTMWKRPAYVYRIIETGELIILLVKRKATWLEGYLIELVEKVSL